MKPRTLSAIPTILIIALLAACSPQAPVTPAAPPPTSPPTVAPPPSSAPPEPTIEPTSTVAPIPTLPAADATITVEGKQCTYDGPDPIPSSDSLSVNWYLNSNESALYGLLVFVLDEGKSADDLRSALKTEGPAPDWISQAGTFSSPGNNSKQVTVKLAQGGPLRGPLYFTCWAGENEDTSAVVATLGPYEVK